MSELQAAKLQIVFALYPGVTHGLGANDRGAKAFSRLHGELFAARSG